jgi:hypothetical protein
MFYNEPQITLQLHSNHVPYILVVAGISIDCARIAKLVIDDQLYTFEDAFIRDQISNKGVEESKEWRKKLGLDAFYTIEAHLAQGDDESLSSIVANSEFKSDQDVEKKKRLYEMQIAKIVHSKIEENPKEISEISEGNGISFDSAESGKDVSVGTAQPTWANVLTVSDSATPSFRIDDRWSSEIDLIKKALLEKGVISSDELEQQ